VVVIGHVTRDELADGEARLGGAGSYGAVAAARAGVATTTVVTVGRPRDPLLAPLRATPGIALACAADGGEEMTTFALGYAADGRRTLALTRRVRSIAIDDVPAAARGAGVVAYVGPVAGECDRALVTALGARFVGVGLQGWLRRAGEGGRVEPALAAEALDPPPVDLAVVSEEDHPEVDAVAARFVAAGSIVAVTRGARGATVLAPGRARPIAIAAAPAREVDPTGAGDTFGVVLTLGLAAGQSIEDAGARAAWAAARAVETRAAPAAPGAARRPGAARQLRTSRWPGRCSAARWRTRRGPSCRCAVASPACRSH